MKYLWELIINILEAAIFFLLLNGKLNKKNIENIYTKQALTLILQATLLFIMNITNAPPLLIILTVIFAHYLYACIFFDSSHIVSLFWVIIFTIINVISDALLTIIPTKILHFDIESIILGGKLRIPFTLLYITVFTIIVIALLFFPSKSFRLNSSDKITFLVLSIICISIEEMIVIGQTPEYNNNREYYSNILYIIFFLVMFIFIVFVFYLYNLGIEKEKNNQLTEMQIQSEIEKKQYEQIVNSISELRYMKHDMNNHLHTLSSLIANGSFSDVNNYINELTNSINTTYYYLSSGNSAVDSIITNKLIQCKEAQITVNYTVHIPNKIPVSDFELCSLLGNLFDNAIEACRKLEETDKRVIDFYIKPYKNMMSLMICNKTNGQYRYDKSNQFLSTKKDKGNREHGIGLKRVKYIVETHDGIIDIVPEKTEFKVSILIPLYLMSE